MPCLRTARSMDPPLDGLQAIGRASVERSAGVASEYETSTSFSYGAPSPRFRGIVSGGRSLPAVALTALAVTYLLLLCFSSKRFRGLEKTGRLLSGGIDEPCEFSGDSTNDEEQRGGAPRQSSELIEHSFPDSGAQGEADEAPQSPTVQYTALDDWWIGGGEGGSVQTYWGEGAGGQVWLPHGEEYPLVSTDPNQGTFEYGEAAGEGTGVGWGQAYGETQILPGQWAWPIHSPSVQGHAPQTLWVDGTAWLSLPTFYWWTGGEGQPSTQPFYAKGTGEGLPVSGEEDMLQSTSPDPGVPVPSTAPSGDTFAEGRTSTQLRGPLWRFQYSGGSQGVGGEEAEAEGDLLPAELTEGLVSFFNRLESMATSCQSLITNLRPDQSRRLTWLFLRLSTMDVAALARIPREIQDHRRRAGNALYGVAVKLISHSQSIGASGTMFIQQLKVFAQMILDIAATWGDATKTPLYKTTVRLEANLRVCQTAMKHYGAVLEGLQWLAEAVPLEQVTSLVERQLRVLEALCAVRAHQVCRESSSRQLIFYFQTAKHFRPLVDVGHLSGVDRSLRPVKVTCLELHRAVALAGGTFNPPRRTLIVPPTPPGEESHGQGGQAGEELHGASASAASHDDDGAPTSTKKHPTDSQRRRQHTPGFKSPLPAGGQNLSALKGGTTAHTSAELGETASMQADHLSQPATQSANPPFPESRRWSKLRHRAASMQADHRSQSATQSANPSSPERRRWSKARHRNTQAKTDSGASELPGPQNP